MSACRACLLSLSSVLLWILVVEITWCGCLVVELHLPSNTNNHAKKQTAKLKYENSVAIPQNPVDSGTFYQLQNVRRTTKTTTTISPMRVKEIPAAVHPDHRRAQEAMKVVNMLADAVEMAKDSLLAKASKASVGNDNNKVTRKPVTITIAPDSADYIGEATTHGPGIGAGYAHHYRAPWVGDVQRRLSDSNSPGIGIRPRPLANDRRLIIPKRKFRPPAGYEPSSGFVLGGNGKSGGSLGHEGQQARTQVEIEMHGDAPVQLEIGKQGAIRVHTDRVVAVPAVGNDEDQQASIKHKAISRSLDDLATAKLRTDPLEVQNSGARMLTIFKYGQTADLVKPQQRHQRSSNNGSGTAPGGNGVTLVDGKQQAAVSVYVTQQQQSSRPPMDSSTPQHQEPSEKGSTTREQQLRQRSAAPVASQGQPAIVNNRPQPALCDLYQQPTSFTSSNNLLQQQLSLPAILNTDDRALRDKMHMLPFFAQLNVLHRRNNKQPGSNFVHGNRSQTGLPLMSAPLLTVSSPKPQAALALTFVKAVTAPANQRTGKLSNLQVPDMESAHQPVDKARFYRSVLKQRMTASRLRHGDIFLLVKRMENKLNKRSSAPKNATGDEAKKKDAAKGGISPATTRLQPTKTTTTSKTTATVKPAAPTSAPQKPATASRTTNKRATVASKVMTAEKRVTKQVITKATSKVMPTKTNSATTKAPTAARAVTITKRIIATKSTARLAPAATAEEKATEANRMVDVEAIEDTRNNGAAPEETAVATASPTTESAVKPVVKKATTVKVHRAEGKPAAHSSTTNAEANNGNQPQAAEINQAPIEKPVATEPASTSQPATEPLAAETSTPLVEPASEQAPVTSITVRPTKKPPPRRTTMRKTKAPKVMVTAEFITPGPSKNERAFWLDALASDNGAPPRQRPKLMKKIDKIADRIAEKLVSRRVWDKSSVKGVLSKSIFEGLVQGNNKKKPRDEFDELLEDPDIIRRKEVTQDPFSFDRSLRELVDDWYPKVEDETPSRVTSKRHIVHKSPKEVLEEEGTLLSTTEATSPDDPQQVSKLRKKEATGRIDDGMTMMYEGEEEAEMELPSERPGSFLFVRPATKLAIPERPVTRRANKKRLTTTAAYHYSDGGGLNADDERMRMYQEINNVGQESDGNGKNCYNQHEDNHIAGEVPAAIMPKSVTVEVMETSGNDIKWKDVNATPQPIVSESAAVIGQATQPVVIALSDQATLGVKYESVEHVVTQIPKEEKSSTSKSTKEQKDHKIKGKEDEEVTTSLSAATEVVQSEKVTTDERISNTGASVSDQQNVIWHTRPVDPHTKWADVEEEPLPKMSRFLNRRSLLIGKSNAGKIPNNRHRSRGLRRITHSIPRSFLKGSAALQTHH